MNEVVRRGLLDRFYETLAEVEAVHDGTRRLVGCSGRMDWPQRGVYFFFEDGELREDGFTPRVVRVGTHALRPSKSTLWGRLSQHKGSEGGSMPGGGNHRGSIFRLHVGTALLEQDGRRRFRRHGRLAVRRGARSGELSTRSSGRSRITSV